MSTYQYNKSQALFERAIKCIPAGIYGHLGPSEGCFIPVEAYPFYVERAEGAYIWDVDGNRFIDYMCAYGPIITGYRQPVVDAAVVEQFGKVDCAVLPTAKMVELAELLVDTVDSADWAFFAKNGGDVTNLAVMSARAATAKQKIIKFDGGYHGVTQWTQTIGSAGITTDDVKNIISIPFNNISALKLVIQEHKDDIAGLIATPYHHPAMADNALPKEGFWQAVRKLCTDNNIVLIIDDVRCGFRLNLKGSDYHYGFKADLICFCKALANGYNMSALCGGEHLKTAVSSVFYTGSYWLSAAPMAAAIANIKLMKKMDITTTLKEKALKLTSGLVEVAKANGYQLIISGEPVMWYMRLADDDGGFIHQRWVSECVKRGVFFTSHHNHFINSAISDQDIDFTLQVADQAFKALKKGE